MLLHILFGFGIGFLSAYVLTLKFTGRLREMEVSRLKKKLAEVKSEADERYKKKEEEVENIKEQIKRDFERDTRSTRKEIKEQKEIISRRTKDLDKKADIIEKREKEIDAKDVEVEKMREALHKKEEELKHIKEREQETLEKISGMSPKQARQRLMKQIEEESKDEAQKLYKSIIESTRRDAKREAVEVIARAIQGNASEVTEELTVASFPLSDDDMKGRIIGREGRNIRALEAATGVNIIIDDTPGVISISSFDGMRREIARRALEELIKDGRIQPTRIEEIVAKVKKEVEDMIISEGEEAAVKANVIGLHDEEIKLLGKMRYRTSYGQNVLNHSVEVANLAGIMAEELDLDVDFARRAGLLHDLGKAIDRETEGSHVEIGSKLAKKYGESHRLQNAILSHHEDARPETVEAVLIQAADTVSASRPGARREQLQNYIKRMGSIEKIAAEFEGVKEAYCLSAGREIRIVVEPNKISEIEMSALAKECARKIEQNIDYPGEVKVTVIRSSRIIETAR